MTTDQPRIVAVPNVADPAAGPTPAELATGTPIDALAAVLGIAAEHAAALTSTARDLATLTSAPPDTILEAFGKALAPEPAVAFRLRIRGAPYLAEAPIAGSPPGYRLHPDRHQRHQDRAAGRPRVWTAPAGTVLPRPVDAPGCHPAFRLLNLLGGTW